MITRIKEFRLKNKMTQETLADLVGLTQGQINRIENGKTDIGIEKLSRFAKVFNVSFVELLPEELTPRKLTPQEQAILDMIRKTKAPDNTDDSAANKAG